MLGFDRTGTRAIKKGWESLVARIKGEIIRIPTLYNSGESQKYDVFGKGVSDGHLKLVANMRP